MVRRVDKPWGHELIWAHTERYVGKVLHVAAGQRLSLQYHERKEETLLLVSGRLRLEIGPLGADMTVRDMVPGDAVHVAPNTVHRMQAIEDSDVVEVSTPELDDVVRMQDDYGRQGTSAP